jgi:hypothetical protein
MAIRLVLTAGDSWRDAAEPWLRGVEAWRDTRPTVVLTPNRAQGFYLRSRLVAEGRPLLGVRFWTPSDARSFLRGLACPDQRAATQTEQALLARACAEKLLRDQPREDEATLRSVVQDPSAFLRAHDLLLGAGWQPSRDGADYGRRLAGEFEKALKRAGLVTQAGLHRELRTASAPAPRPIVRLLVLGFSSVHWPLWDLLQATCLFAEDVEVALDPPAVFGENVDQLWIGSWQTFAGVDFEIAEDAPSDLPLAPLAQSYELGRAEASAEAPIHFLATTDLDTQVRAITLQVLDYLRSPTCTRLGIVFPEADALALGVAVQLRELGIPLNDSLGALKPGLFETRPWQTWLDLQEEPTVRRMVAWLRACEAGRRNCGLQTLPLAEAADLLDRALGKSLVDHLDYLADQLDTKGDYLQVAAFLHKRLVLPEEGTLDGFLVTTREALRRLEWNDFLESLPGNPPAGLENIVISRRAFLAWLRETGDSRERVRPDGNHFYGKVHLLVYSQLAGQEWTHLVLTGLNEGAWPRLFEAGAFGSRHELAELNAKVHILNRRGARQGRLGEGHDTVAPGHGHCLLPVERRDLALRDLCAALRSTREAICVAARTLAQGRNLLPSDFFSHAWQVKTGHVLDDAMFRELAEKTAERCREHAALFPKPETEPPDTTATKKAYDERRHPDQSFGPYEFSFAQPPAEPIQLACKEWETAFSHPADVWLSRIVGVAPWPEGNLSWKMSLGTWAHRWLSQAIPGATPDNLADGVRTAATHDLKVAEKRARDVGIELYPWWRQMWNQALSVALALAHGLAPALRGRKAIAEVALPRSLMMALPGSVTSDFAARGKLDLVLLEPETTRASAPELDLSGCTAWVIDFKTGAASKLTAKKLEKGAGLQVALYGLALRARGATSVSLTLLTPGAELAEQLGVSELLGMREPFRTIDAMRRTGVFGQAPKEDDDHGFGTAYPMTTRAIEKDVIAAKWKRLHGAIE